MDIRVLRFATAGELAALLDNARVSDLIGLDTPSRSHRTSEVQAPRKPRRLANVGKRRHRNGTRANI